MRSNPSSNVGGVEPAVRRIDHEDGNAVTLVIDLGASEHGVHTDVVDDTLIVVRDRPDGSEHTFEFELPAGQARTFMKNGVLTVEVRE